MRNPYEIAETLNRMKPGDCMTFDRDFLQGIVGTASFIPSGRAGWQVVLDNVIGSNTPDWLFETNLYTGSVTCKKAEPQPRNNRVRFNELSCTLYFRAKTLIYMVGRDGLEPPTFSV